MRFQLIGASVLALSSSLVSAGVKWAGINIAGFDFGCDIYVGVYDALYSLDR